MLQRIPDRVDPWRLAEQGETLEGHLKLDSLPRLAPLLANADGEAAFVLTFGRDERRRLVVTLKVAAELYLECQRCLDDMLLKVDSKTRLAPVSGLLEAEQLPADLDPLLLAEGEYLDIAALIEDELMLGIPSSPRHEEQNCNRQAGVEEHGLTEDEPKEENPFAILAGLKTGGNDN
ncbi:YceD family protein [Thiolapillus sp.]